MRNGPSLAVPGVFSPDEPDTVSLPDIQNAMRHEPEIGDALDQLVFSLERGISKAAAFDTYEERMWFLYLRNRSRLENA